MKLNDYRTIGNSGLRVSRFCLGGMTFGGEDGIGCSEKMSNRIIDKFIDHGGNFIDTANGYTKGNSEIIIGKYLANSGKRDRIVLGTKFTSNAYRYDPNGGGSSRKAIIEQCEQSLRRLNTDYIDLYWMHCWDDFTPIEETMRALDDLTSAGKIRYIGVSDTPAWKIAQANTMADFKNWNKFIALQMEYSLLERTVEGELVPMAEEFGLGITPWSPLKYGVLTGKHTRETIGDSKRLEMIKPFLNEKTFEILDYLNTCAKELDTSASRIALSWVLNRPGVTSPILGARKLEHLEDNIAAIDLVLPEEINLKLDKLTTPKLNFPADFLSRMQPMAIGNCAKVNNRESQVWEG